MIKKLFLISVLVLAFSVLAFSVPAFAGEGSDTIGACRLLPQLRYEYYETPVDVTHYPAALRVRGGRAPHFHDNWKLTEHDVTLQVDYGVTDYFDVYAFAGARIAAEKFGRVTLFDVSGLPTNEDFEFDLVPGFIGGGGVKGTCFRAQNGFYFGWGMSFTYAVTNNEITLEERDATVTGLEFRETDIAATADLHVGWHIADTGLTPYLGVEYRWNREHLRAEKSEVDSDANDWTTESKNPVGVYVGLDYLWHNRLYFNVEGQMIKRWGGSLSVGYLFDLCAKPAPVVVPPPVAPPIEPKLEPMSFK